MLPKEEIVEHDQRVVERFLAPRNVRGDAVVHITAGTVRIFCVRQDDTNTGASSEVADARRELRVVHARFAQVLIEGSEDVVRDRRAPIVPDLYLKKSCGRVLDGKPQVLCFVAVFERANDNTIDDCVFECVCSVLRLRRRTTTRGMSVGFEYAL